MCWRRSGEPDPDYERLTPREKQILELIAKGNSNKEIAAILNLSVNTVSVHRANLMSALGIHRTTELVVWAVKKGLVQSAVNRRRVLVGRAGLTAAAAASPSRDVRAAT